MRLTMTGEYAIRTMLHLASVPAETTVQIPEVSHTWDIPEGFLRKIVPQLSKAGLIHSRRGVGGGIQLARPAEAITLLDVIEAVEGKLSLNYCLLNPLFCHRTPWCAVHIVWCEAQQKLKEILSKRSLAELAVLHAARSSQYHLHPEQQLGSLDSQQIPAS